MQLFAYNPIGEPHQLLIWVGILGSAQPPSVSFEIAGQLVVAQLLPPGFEPLGDEQCDAAGRPLNQRALFALPWPSVAGDAATVSERFAILVRAGSESIIITSKRPAVQLPPKSQPSFNLLLSSCYYQPNDKSMPLGRLLQRLKPAPDLTLLAGDQVYLDLPSPQNLPKQRQALAQTLGKKYQTNWFSAGLQQPGLAEVLRHGPVLCIPDDHEFWNNYPLFQAQLNNTHFADDRATWGELANRLYERYQRSPVQCQGFFRWDIAPMSMLFLDSRTQRDARGDAMFNGATLAALTQWKQDLLARKQQQLPAVGLLSSGQALLMEKPGRWERRYADMEMVNYRDFVHLEAVFTELFAAEIPVIYITGDVHWGRIVSGRNQRGQTLFYEVIASPSRLLDTLGNDQLNTAKNWWSSWQGKAETFPLHPIPQPITGLKFANLQLQLEHSQRGDHVALLRFNGMPGGVEFYVDYVCTHADDRTRQQYSPTCGPFNLNSL